MRVGRVYRIEYNEDPDIRYVGSTFQPVSKRWQDHKSSFNSYLKGGTEIAIYPYFKTYGIENFKIILIKEYDVSDKEHLLAYESLWICKLKCVNRQASFTIPFLQKIKKKETCKKYREANRYKIQDYNKKYYETNKEKAKKYYEVNREDIAEKGKTYRETNRDIINEKRSQKIKCDCGAEIRKDSLARHRKTKKHKEYQEYQENQ